MEGGGAEQLAGQVAQNLLARPLLQALLEQAHGPLAAGHGLSKLIFVDGLSRLPGDEFSHLPQLVGHILHGLGGRLEGNINGEMRHAVKFRQIAERQLVGVAGQGGGENEAGLGHQPHLGRPDEDFMIGT